MKKRVLTLAVIAAMLSSPVLSATKINGFASIKAGMTTSSDEKLFNYTDQLNFKNESLLAVQVKSELGDKLSVTAQIMGRGSNDFKATFEWAFVSYQLNDESFINAGRLRIPFYKYSDFRDVGYAYDWLRVPQSVYGLSFNNIEGISYYYTSQIGAIDSNVQLLAGSYDGDVILSGSPASAQINNVLGATWELSYDGYSIRTAYLKGKATVTSANLQPLFNVLTTNRLQPLVAALDFNEDPSSFIGLGFNVDRDDWVIAAEFNKIDVDQTFFAERTNYYLSVGKRFGAFTPFISAEKEDHKAKASIYAPYQTLLPAALLRPVIGVVQSQQIDAVSYNAGLRYDFHSSAALKMQYTSREDQLLDQRAGLLTIGIDLVF